MHHSAEMACLLKLETAGCCVVMMIVAMAMVLAALLATEVLNADSAADYREIGCEKQESNMAKNAFHNLAQSYNFFRERTKKSRMFF